MPCLHAISSALEEDPAKRMGSASFLSFTDNPFFRPIDFEALERKEIEPVFVPSGEKTNFDATYDLEELLLEEAPLEARARRQKPREQLKEDATDKEIREDELHKMIEAQFTPFDYTTAAYERSASFPYCLHPNTDQACQVCGTIRYEQPKQRLSDWLDTTTTNATRCGWEYAKINDRTFSKPKEKLEISAYDPDRLTPFYLEPTSHAQWAINNIKPQPCKLQTAIEPNASATNPALSIPTAI
jgi:hypothetical protein